MGRLPAPTAQCEGLELPRRREPRPRRAGSGTSFEDYSRRWLQAKTEGAYGEIRAGTAASYRCCLERHLLPAFEDCAAEEIDRARCLRLTAALIANARELREASAAGLKVRGERGRQRKPLGAASIRSVLQVVAAILDEAVEDEMLESNPAQGKRMRVRVPSPVGRFWRWTSSPHCCKRPARRSTGTSKSRSFGSIFTQCQNTKNSSVHRRSDLNGESRNRTDDTTIFSRVLYQLSYLAACRYSRPVDASGRARARGARRCGVHAASPRLVARRFPGLEIGERVDRVPARRLPAADPHLEVQVRRGGVAGLAHETERLAG